MEPLRFENGRPMLLGGLRRQHPYAESARGIPAQWLELQALMAIPGQVGNTAYGVMCGHDAGGFEYMCGLEVESFATLPAHLGRMRILAQRYAVFAHAGHVSGIRDTWEKIYLWLADSGYQSANKPDFEVYGPGFDPRTGRGDIEIRLAVASADA
jgi:predicted transcriptional regulator YdeE